MILDLLYPGRCPVCNEILPFGYHGACRSCAPSLSYVSQPACMGCGKELEPAEAEEEYCRDCLRHRRSFAGGIALLNYNEAARRIMMGLKYKNRREYARFLADEMLRRHGRRILRLKADALVPVPIHRDRRRERGYNQAELLAKELSRGLSTAISAQKNDSSSDCRRKDGIPVKNLLLRVENTAAQKSLGYEARQKNEAKAFRAAGSCGEYRRLLLVDDIYTTGATAQACAQALLSAGADEVWILSMAIGMGRQ